MGVVAPRFAQHSEGSSRAHDLRPFWVIRAWTAGERDRERHACKV